MGAGQKRDTIAYERYKVDTYQSIITRVETLREIKLTYQRKRKEPHPLLGRNKPAVRRIKPAGEKRHKTFAGKTGENFYGKNGDNFSGKNGRKLSQDGNLCGKKKRHKTFAGKTGENFLTIENIF